MDANIEQLLEEIKSLLFTHNKTVDTNKVLVKMYYALLALSKK